jgi:hypothetical protein
VNETQYIIGYCGVEFQDGEKVYGCRVNVLEFAAASVESSGIE